MNRMLAVLLAKDLRRARRNPLPWVINLIVPLVLTALIGLVFGGRSDGAALGRIRFAVVDEDNGLLGKVLRGGVTQGQGAQHLDPVFLDRAEALRQVNDNQLSAVLILPAHFTSDYLAGSNSLRLELIKNPAESIHPAVMEELLRVVVTAMNTVARVFHGAFAGWRQEIEGDRDYHHVARLIEDAGDRLKSAKAFINPPLVTYDLGDAGADAKAADGRDGSQQAAGAPKAAAPATKAARGATSGIFAYVLCGFAAMFLLFLANTAMTDLHREIRLRTFERYRTIRDDLGTFILGKVVFGTVMLLICAAIMLGGGGLMFGIHWRHPGVLAALILCYATFAATLFALLVALVPDERRANALSTVTGMLLGCAGGCAFPVRQLPAFLRDHVTPLLPTNWFVETARDLQFGAEPAAFGLTALKLLAAALVLGGVTAVLFRRRFAAGTRA